jgi:cytochrome c oxidase cbb3-type subunit IV
MNIGLLQGIYTIVALVAFLWICVWAMSPRRNRSFNEAAMLPFEAEAAPPPERPGRAAEAPDFRAED